MSKNWKKFAESGKIHQKSERFNRKYKGKSSKNTQLEGSFITPIESWPKTLGPEEKIDETSESGFVGRVVEVHKRYAFVSPEHLTADKSKVGRIDTPDVWLASISRKFLQAQRKERNLICVGDRVYCVPGSSEAGNVSQELPQCNIELRAPRQSEIARLDPMTSERKHTLAANFDQLFIVASILDPKVKWGLIDRYLVLSESENINAHIVLTKRDLIDDMSECDRNSLLSYIDIYRSIGYPVHLVQSNVEEGPHHAELEKLQDVFRNKVSLLSGHSGVGKSSVVNSMDPEIVQDVEEDEILYKGRHTTTYSSFLKLKMVDGYVIDTPGIRSFCIEELDSVHLSYCYLEFRPFLGKCKYRECQHREEPDCAIKEAVKEGKISEWRYKSYLGILLGATGREGRLRDISLE